MKKSFFLALTLIVSVQVVFAGEPGESKNPLLTAGKIEIYEENNLMIIHEPKFSYKGEKLNVIAYGPGIRNHEVIHDLCLAFNAKGVNSESLKFYNFYSYFKMGVGVRADGSVREIKAQSMGSRTPIKSVECIL